MLRIFLSTALTLPLLLGACAGVGSPSRKIVATASLLNGESVVAGNASLFAVGDRLDLRIEVRNLSPGSHGAHLHGVGKCQPKDFASAGGHLNPGGRQHGTMNPQGSHLGDLPNIEVAANGSGVLDVLLQGDRKSIEAEIFDADGTAIIVHAGPDDYRTDPSGASGGRVACGVFTSVH